MSQLTVKEMRDRITAAARLYYDNEYRKAWCLFTLTTIEGSGCKRYRKEVENDISRLKQECAGLLHNIENMSDAEITSMYTEIFAS